MTMSRPARLALLAALLVGLAVIYIPLLVVLINSFNADATFAWPPDELTTKWWHLAIDNTGARSAIWTSVKAGLLATLFALTLGTLAAFALQRYRFFGRDAISLLVILPIALPGIVTGIALNNAFRTI